MGKLIIDAGIPAEISSLFSSDQVFGIVSNYTPNPTSIEQQTTSEINGIKTVFCNTQYSWVDDTSSMFKIVFHQGVSRKNATGAIQYYNFFVTQYTASQSGDGTMQGQQIQATPQTFTGKFKELPSLKSAYHKTCLKFIIEWEVVVSPESPPATTLNNNKFVDIAFLPSDYCFPDKYREEILNGIIPYIPNGRLVSQTIINNNRFDSFEIAANKYIPYNSVRLELLPVSDKIEWVHQYNGIGYQQGSTDPYNGQAVKIWASTLTMQSDPSRDSGQYVYNPARPFCKKKYDGAIISPADWKWAERVTRENDINNHSLYYKSTWALPESISRNLLVFPESDMPANLLTLWFMYIGKSGKLFFVQPVAPSVVIPTPPSVTPFYGFTELYDARTNTRTRRLGGTLRKISSSSVPATLPSLESGILIACNATAVEAPTYVSTVTPVYEYFGNYSPATTITFAATPDADNIFLNWEFPTSFYNDTALNPGITSGQITVTVANQSLLDAKQQNIAVNSCVALTAVFAKPNTFTVVISPVGSGKVYLQPTSRGWGENVAASITLSVATNIPSATYDFFTLTATPNAGYEFAYWETTYNQRLGDRVKNDSDWSTGAYIQRTLKTGSNVSHLEKVNWEYDGIKDCVYTAVFTAIPNVNLTFTVYGDGTAKAPGVTFSSQGSPSPPYPYLKNSVIEIEASPNTNYSFDKWTGSVSSTEAKLSLPMYSDQSLAVFFSPNPQLTVEIIGTGKVTALDGLINCEAAFSVISGDYKEQYVKGTWTILSASIVATPFDDWYFSHWEGDVSESLYYVAIQMNTNTTVTAVFKKYPMLVIGITAGYGQVIGSPPDVLGGDFSVSKDGWGLKKSISGVETLTAVPASGYKLKLWEGDIRDYRPVIVVQMNQQDKNIYANFVRIYKLILNVNLQGVGRVYDSSWTFDNEETSVTDVESGAELKVMAFETNSEYAFSHWESSPGLYNGSTSNPLQLSPIVCDLTLTAIFDKKQHSVHIIASPADDGGTIAGSGFYNVSIADLRYFYINTEITLTATPADGYLFYHWNGDFQTSDNPLTFTLSEDTKIEAVFYQPTDWLVKRLSPPKKLSETWKTFAQINERFWESNFDWALNRLRNALSFYTSDFTIKKKYIAEFQGYYRVDFPPEDIEIFLSDRRSLIAIKGQHTFYQETLDRIDSHASVELVILYANSDEPYGVKFYTDDEFSENDLAIYGGKYYPTSRCFLKVNNFPLSPNSPDKWSETFRQIKPVETVFDGGRFVPFFSIGYESEMDLDFSGRGGSVEQNWQVNTFEVTHLPFNATGGTPREIFIASVFNNNLMHPFQTGDLIIYYSFDVSVTPMDAIKILVTENSLNATLYAKWQPGILPNNNFFDQKAVGVAGKNYEMIIPVDLAIGRYYVGIKADRAGVRLSAGAYIGNNGYYVNGSCKIGVEAA